MTANPNYARQIAALKESDTEIMREVAALKARIDAVVEAAQSENKAARSDNSAEFARLRADMEKRFAELRSEMDQRFADLRGEMDQRFADLRADMEKRIADLRVDMEKRFADLRSDMEKGFAELREEIKKNEVEAARRETRMIQAVHTQTKWIITAALTVVAAVIAAARYIGPATGAG